MPSAPSSHPLLPSLLLGLTVVTGLVDAVSYLALGHVFTANMTGNVVFLGFAAAGAPGLSVSRSLTALAAFLVGAAVGGRLAGRAAHSPAGWVGSAFSAEAVLLAAAALAARGQGGDLQAAPLPLYIVIVLTGLALGLRNATVRRLAIPDLTTTVLTLTLTGLAADSPLGGGSGAGASRRLLAVAAMLAGAGLGAALLRFSVATPLAVCAAVSGTCALLVARALTERSEEALP
jgi:uncharacterized membrane protein YoaK (UPF0700 family)